MEGLEISCADHELEDWTHGKEEEEKEDLVISRKRDLHTQAVGRVSLHRSNATAKGQKKSEGPARAGLFPFSTAPTRRQAKRISRPGANW